MVTYTEAWNIVFKTSKPLWNLWKYQMNIYHTMKETNLKAERKTHSNR